MTWLRRDPASAITDLKMAKLEISSEDKAVFFSFFCFIIVSVWNMSNFYLVFLSYSSSSFLRLLCAESSSSIILEASSNEFSFSV